MTPFSDSKKTLRVGALSRLGTIDIREADDSVSHLILEQIFESPFASPASDGSPEPLLFAEPLKREATSGGHDVWSGKVRSGVVFSDGTPLTAELVAESLRKAADVQVRADVTWAGDRVLFTMKSPNPRFDLFLTQTLCGIVLEKGDRLLGTGPFMFPEGASKRQVLEMNPLVVVRNPRYRDPVALDGISFFVYPPSPSGGTEMLLEAAKREEFDFTWSLTSVDAGELRSHPYIPSIAPGNATGILFFNTAVPALKSRHVRRAIAFAIDRSEIARKTYPKNPIAFVASSLLPPFLGKERDHIGFRPNDVRAEIQAAGTAAPSKLSLLVTWSPRPYMPNPRAAAELIKDALARIPIDVELIIPRDRADFFDRVKAGRFELAIAGWIADTPDPADYLEALLHSAMIPKAGKVTATSNNLSRWNHAETDAVLSQFRADPTPANRAVWMKLIDDEAPLVPLIHGQAVAVYHRKVMGFRPSPLGRSSFAKVKLVP